MYLVSFYLVAMFICYIQVFEIRLYFSFMRNQRILLLFRWGEEEGRGGRERGGWGERGARWRKGWRGREKGGGVILWTYSTPPPPILYFYSRSLVHTLPWCSGPPPGLPSQRGGCHILTAVCEDLRL